MRYVEVRRHTDYEGDRLTSAGIADAEALGGTLRPPYAAFISTGAARCTQMLEILRAAAGQDDVPITDAIGLRSVVRRYAKCPRLFPRAVAHSSSATARRTRPPSWD